MPTIRSYGGLFDTCCAGEGVPPPHRDEALQEMCSRGKELIDAQQLIEAAEILSEALAPYKLDSPPAAQALLVIEAITLLQSMAASSGDLDALLRSNEEIVRRFASASDPAVREQVAQALWNRAFYAEYAGDADQAAVGIRHGNRRQPPRTDKSIRERQDEPAVDVGRRGRVESRWTGRPVG
jgi:hypothetical protein